MRATFGVVRRSEALAVGMTPGMVDGLVRRGQWEVVERGVYRLPGGHVPSEQAYLAAVWRAGPGAVLTAESVLALFNVEGFELDHKPVVLCPHHRRLRGVGFEVRYRPSLPLGQTALVNGIPIATVARAFVDLALRVRGKAFRVAYDSARRQRLVDRWRLRHSAVTALPQHGARWVLEMVASGVLDYESEPERVIGTMFAGHDPPLEFQVWLLPGVRVDAVWRDARLIIEYDGQHWHTLPTDREADAQRRARLQAAGWSVFVVTRDMLEDPPLLRRRIIARRAQCVRGVG